jgi:hypothetical protein
LCPQLKEIGAVLTAHSSKKSGRCIYRSTVEKATLKEICQLCGDLAECERNLDGPNFCNKCEADVAAMTRIYQQLQEAEGQGRDGTPLVCELMSIFLRRGDFTALNAKSLLLTLKKATQLVN